MKFSTQGDRILKEFFSTQKKLEMVEEIEKRINKMEECIMNFLESDYSQLIDECSYLEELKEKMLDLRIVNADVSKIANGLSISVKHHLKDGEELNKCINRISVCKREMGCIENFLELLLSVNIFIEQLEKDKKENIDNQIKDKKLNLKQLSINEKEYNKNESSLDHTNNASNLAETNSNSEDNEQQYVNNQNSSTINQTNSNNVSEKASTQTTIRSSVESMKTESSKLDSNDKSSIDQRNQTAPSYIFKHDNVSNNRDVLSHYKNTKGLISMEQMVETFAKFYFYNGFKKTFNSLKNTYKNYLFEDLKDLIILDWFSIGKNIEINNTFSLFDGFNCSNFVPKYINLAIYSIKKLNYIDEATMVINQYRKNIFEQLSKEVVSDEKVTDANVSDDTIYFYIGNLLLSHVLSKDFPQCNTLHSQIFTNISNLKLNDSKDISKLRNLSKKLHLSDPLLDSSIENLVFNYLDQSFKQPDILKFSIENLIQNIEKCIVFVSEINQYEGEFNNLLTMKIDDSFIYKLNNSSEKDFFVFSDAVKNFHQKLKKNKIFKNAKFDCCKEIDRIMKRLAENKVDDVATYGYNKTNEEIIKKIIGMKEVGTPYFRNIFVEIFTEKAPQIYSSKPKEDLALFINAANRNLGNK